MRVCARHWQRAAPQICKSMFQNQRGTRQWRVSVGHDNIAHVRFIIFLFVRAVHFSDAVSNILVQLLHSVTRRQTGRLLLNVHPAGDCVPSAHRTLASRGQLPVVLRAARCRLCSMHHPRAATGRGGGVGGNCGRD